MVSVDDMSVSINEKSGTVRMVIACVAILTFIFGMSLFIRDCSIRSHDYKLEMMKHQFRSDSLIAIGK